MISKDRFLLKYHIDAAEFDNAEIEWDELVKIYDDFENKHKEQYEKILNDFISEYLSDIGSMGIHSFRYRVKDSEHIIEKIIRKINTSYKKYRKISLANYRRLLTDLAGVRCFMLFKDDWRTFHKYITRRVQNVRDWYMTEEGETTGPVDGVFFAESPKVHIRRGDENIYKGIIKDENILDERDYRSIHYIVFYKGIWIEIQVRTFFEEGWGEIDHRLKYPYFENDEEICKISKLLSRISGTADELGMYFESVYNSKYEMAKKAQPGNAEDIVQVKKRERDVQPQVEDLYAEKEFPGDNLSVKDIVKQTINEG